MELRRHLVILAALTILPLLGFATWVVLELHHEERSRAERSLTDTARALSLGLDREIAATIAALQALATSKELDAGNLRAFYEQARALQAGHRDWATILLADASGRPLLNLRLPFGATPPPLAGDPEDVRRVAATGRPVVTDAFEAPLAKTLVVGIRVPVVREGRVTHVLGVGIPTRELRDILLQQRLPADWIGTILDRKRRIIARTRGEEQFLGQPASERLLEASAKASEGWYRGLTKEGVKTYSAFSRSGLTGLTVALGVPAAGIEAPLRRSLWRIAGGGLLTLALGVAIAIYFARRIAGPIAALAVSARDIARGKAPSLTATSITEVNELGRALTETAGLVTDERRTLETINQTGQLLSAELSLERLVQGVTDASTRLCRAAFGAFFYNVVDDRGEAYTLSTISGVPREAFADFPMPRNTELFGPTFRGERVVRIDDVTTDPRHGKNPPYHGMPPGHLPVRSYLAVPVVSRGGDVLGGLFFGHPEPGVFTKREEDIVMGLAPQIATAIDHARLYERQQAARAEAEAANTMKDEFLATLSHELRTPLNAVLGWTRMLRSGQLSEEAAARALEVIERNGNAQVQLIEDLLDVSRIITGKLRLDVRRVEPAGIVEAAVDAVRPAAEAKDIRLQSILDPRAGPVSADPDRLQQIVWNLLSNAIKFTPRGGRMQIRLQRVNSQVEIVVTDTGHGIAADVLPHIFERFRQADSSSQRAYGGLGIGLALVKHLVELQGGSVAAASPGAGQGATFTVSLPLMLHAAAPVPGVAPAPARQTPATIDASLRDISLLVVDDDGDALDLFALLLRAAGAEVQLARSAREAIETLRTWEPDVIVSDIEMPGESGYALIRRLRSGEVPHGDRVPAVAVTAYGGVAERIKILSAGFDAYVAKPVESDELATVIARLVARARSMRKPGEE
ncbi:MAG TPA: ATP-binding protein [Methylomirabilota bacterium]|jgi:signal transduction histidine kinase/ActR/RegA family two-component response regulator|nr:ATP-binding protein [Methylomirabilota bacterium]